MHSADTKFDPRACARTTRSGHFHMRRRNGVRRIRTHADLFRTRTFPLRIVCCDKDVSTRTQYEKFKIYKNIMSDKILAEFEKACNDIKKIH